MTGGLARPKRAAVSVLLALSLAGQLIAAGPSRAQVQVLTCPPPGFGGVVAPPAPGVLPFIPLASLKTVPNPVLPKDPVTGAPTLRADLAEHFVADLNAAIRLGKALFWDMQAGSDNRTACASCHFHAGGDPRTRNQFHPGANGTWDGYGPNWPLAASDFPFTDPAAGRDRDNIAGSQGVRNSVFRNIGRIGGETARPVADPVFSVAGEPVRQVTGKNTPAAINAVFNHRNFHNGRAQPEFNGVNPFGDRDAAARVWEVGPLGRPVPINIRIRDASLASQAVGPPGNSVEMAASGRTFPDLGKKLLLAKPLGLQKVDPSDSVLGPLAGSPAGLNTSYADLIRQAFQPRWWNTKRHVTIKGDFYSLMEANFSLFWGLAIMLYEATLVADDSPMDRYLTSRSAGVPDPTLLDPVVARVQAEYQAVLPGQSLTTDNILNGLALFELPIPPPGTVGIPAGMGTGCSLCHVGAETTSASVQNLSGTGPEPGHVAFRIGGFDVRMERMFMQLPPVPAGTTSITYDPATHSVWLSDGSPVRVATYDSGWYNIGVRPTADDLGLGGQDPFGNGLSWVRLFQALLNPSVINVSGGGLGCPSSPPAAPTGSPFAGEVLNPLTGFPLLAGPLTRSEPTDVDGSFKVPGLRNAELTGPYFHNGGKATLLQAMELYDNGGDFANATLSPLIRPLGLSPQQKADLVAFLLAMTDERVRLQQAPFDHPQLFTPNGGDPAGVDSLVELPAVGAAGSPSAPLPRFLGLNPFQP